MSRHILALLIALNLVASVRADRNIGSDSSSKQPDAKQLSEKQLSAVTPDRHRALLKEFCFDCHDQQAREGQVDLQNLPFDLATIESAEMWQRVLGVLNSGEMPPEDQTQIPDLKKQPADPVEEPGEVEGFEEIKVMYDLMVAAMQADATRVMTYRQQVGSLIKSLGAKISAPNMSHYTSGE